MADTPMISALRNTNEIKQYVYDGHLGFYLNNEVRTIFIDVAESTDFKNSAYWFSARYITFKVRVTKCGAH